MPIPFTCPHCQTASLVNDEYAGQSGPCRQCGAQITVPFSAAPPESSQAPDAVLIASIAAAALYAGTAFLLYVCPTIYTGFSFGTLSGLALLQLYLSPVLTTLALGVMGGFVGGVYFGVLSSMLDQQPRPVRAALLAGLVGYLAGAIVSTMIASYSFYAIGAWISIMANMLKIMAVAVVAGTAGAFVFSLIAGMANLPVSATWSPASPSEPPPPRVPLPRRSGESADAILRRVASSKPSPGASRTTDANEALRPEAEK